MSNKCRIWKAINYGRWWLQSNRPITAYQWQL